ncbi:hypothetical protein N788_06395 [Arenimonas donghaensis DSM 18148 = HO3-R19]|uniref:Glycosyltransferase subfamily 4-like N-terminal domain-containing protein n=1 Tax=Arenimonas donghaensis DSM 18148 = HO3-R19 TaxID=1121014 RepID=A0A087MG96_9GAMM|nr:hypothetical protein N788_06395 [Arenimonas donghaensis DSM 18148 = HO3-R19]
MLVLASTYPRWTGDPEPGFVHALCTRLAAQFDVLVLCPHSPGSTREETMEGVRVVRYRYAPDRLQTLVNDGGILGNLKKSKWKWLLVPGFLLSQVFTTARLVRSYRPDVVHAHWLVPQGLAAALALAVARKRPRFVVTSHGADLFSLGAWPFRVLKRFVLGRADLATVVSHAMLPAIKALGSTCDVVVEPMGVDLVGTFCPKPDVQRSPSRALFVGRLVEKKGVDHLIRAWPHVLERIPTARLDIAGFGSCEPELRALRESLGLSGSIEFLGPVSHERLPDLYRSAAALVVPFVAARDGDQEGLGLVMVEAIGCGCPVVAGDVPAVRDVIGGNGGQVDPRDPVRLAEVIVKAMQGGAADPAAVARFDWGPRAKAYADLLGAARQEPARSGHAATGMASRKRKAIKIARLLGLEPGAAPRRLLEVGTGAGGIAHYFGAAGTMNWDVDAVDVSDNRICKDGYRFTLVDGVELPYPDASFDVVVSNHVIEHVGDDDAQARHLAEIARVLRPDGTGYLAVPNRWMLVEPHFKLPLLSWLPGPLADRYVRWSGKGTHYDCRPATVPRIERALAGAGFRFTQCHGQALRLTYEIERPASTVYRWVLKPIPDQVYRALRRLFPTLIYVLHKAGGPAGKPE